MLGGAAQSHFSAWTQKWLDGLTNSVGQGFRLEGFDNPPLSMQSIFDHANTERHAGIGEKQMQRFLLQRMPAKEFLKFFLDVHTREASSLAEAELKSLSDIETEELLLSQTGSTVLGRPS